MELEDARAAAVSGRGPNAPQVAATVYVGDQLARIADMMQAAPQPLLGMAATMMDVLSSCANVVDQIAPEDRGTPYRTVRATAGLKLADAEVQPAAISEAREGLKRLSDHLIGSADSLAVAYVQEIRRLLG